MNRIINILIVEFSPIVSEGLAVILNKSELKCQFTFIQSLDDIERIVITKKFDIFIINPLFIVSNLKFFKAIRNQYYNLKLIGLIYAWHDPNHIQFFDGLITISDTPESIVTTIKKLITEASQTDQNISQEVLSNRETDVLKLLATGLANKEIADKLNISTHTVISHRKNISHKTGIKSVSGLTIYAVVQKLISIDSLTE